MFGRAMADRHGVGIIVSIDYHGASYGIQTPRLLCKHLTAAEVHPVPAGLTLAHRLGPDATPARRFAATAVDDGAFQRLFEAYKPDSDAPDHLLHRQTRYAFAQAAETLNWRGMADAMATLPRVTSLSPSATFYDWAMDVMSAACDGTAMPERPHGLYAERARAERRSKAIMPTTFAALCERERLAAFADVCRQWRVLGQVVEAPADGRHTGSDNAVPTPGTLRNDPILASRMRASAVSTADNGLWNPRSHCPANMSGSAPSYRTPPSRSITVSLSTSSDAATARTVAGRFATALPCASAGVQRAGNPTERSR